MAAKGCTLTVAVGQAPSTQTDFIWVLTTGNLPSAAVDGSTGSITNGGGNLRAYTDDTKTIELPLEVLTCVTGGSPDVLIWGKSPSIGVGSTVYLEADETETSQPAVSALLGRNAVWSDALWRYHLDEDTGTVATDSAGNFDGTYKGSLPSIQADDSQKFINNNDRLQTNDSGMDYSAFAITATIKGNGTNSPKQIVSNDDSNSGNAKRQFQFRLSKQEKLEVILFHNGTIFLNQQTGATITSKTIVNLTYDGTTYRVYSGATQVLAFASTTLIASTTPASSWVGARFDNNHEAFKGFMWDAQMLSGISKSADQIATEVNNQEDPAAFWSTGLWEEQTTTGGITTLPTGIPSDESFGTPTLLKRAIVTALGVTSEETLGEPSLSESVAILPNGVLSTGVVGSPTLSTMSYIAPDAVLSEEIVGSPSTTVAEILYANGIESTETIGIVELLSGTRLLVSGIPTTAIVGDPHLMYNQTILLDSINSSETFGANTKVIDPAAPIDDIIYKDVFSNVYKDSIGIAYDIRA